LVDDLIERIYEAAVMPHAWPDVLDRLGRRFHAKGGLLFANSPDGTRWLGGGEARQGMEDFLRQGWMDHNKRPAMLLERAHPGFLSETDLQSEEELNAQPMFKEFLLPRGYVAAAGTFVPGLDSDRMILSVEGFPAHAAAREAIPPLDALRPHLARAAQLASQFRLERMKGHVDALAAIGAAAGVLNSRGAVQVTNARFQAELGSTVWDRPARIYLADRRADAQLEQSIALMQRGVREGRSIAVKNHDGSSRVMHLLPIHREANDLFVSSSALVILTNPAQKVPVRTDVLQNLFDLTPAEARLAARLCAGEADVVQIAKEFGVSVPTLRTQVRSVYAKTGVHRQLDLSRLLIATDTIGHA